MSEVPCKLSGEEGTTSRFYGLSPENQVRDLNLNILYVLFVYQYTS